MDVDVFVLGRDYYSSSYTLSYFLSLSYWSSGTDFYRGNTGGRIIRCCYYRIFVVSFSGMLKLFYRVILNELDSSWTPMSYLDLGRFLASSIFSTLVRHSRGTLEAKLDVPPRFGPRGGLVSGKTSDPEMTELTVVSIRACDCVCLLYRLFFLSSLK